VILGSHVFWQPLERLDLAIRLAIYWAEHHRIRPHETDRIADVTCYNRTQHNSPVP
jgi:hypothetical protein